MRKWSWIFALATLVALPAFAQSAFPDLRGTWKGQSESIVSGTANPHQDGTPGSPPRYSSAPFRPRRLLHGVHEAALAPPSTARALSFPLPRFEAGDGTLARSDGVG
jgi:hypothetical protein